MVIEDTAKQVLPQVLRSGSPTRAGTVVRDVALGKAQMQPTPDQQVFIELAAGRPNFPPLRPAFFRVKHGLLEADETPVAEGQDGLEMLNPPEVFQFLCVEAVQQRVHQMKSDGLQGARFSGE